MIVLKKKDNSGPIYISYAEVNTVQAKIDELHSAGKAELMDNGGYVLHKESHVRVGLHIAVSGIEDQHKDQLEKEFDALGFKVMEG